jgi:hypothetical protein
MQTSPNPLLIALAIIALVVLRFLWRELRVRRLKPSTIFILPIFFALIVALTIFSVVTGAPDQLFALIVGSGAAIVVGAGVGIAVAHFTTVQAGPAGTLLVRGSWITVAIWLAALALRLAARWIVSGGKTVFVTSMTSVDHPSLMLNAVLVVMLATAMMVVRLRILAVGRRAPADQPVAAA